MPSTLILYFDFILEHIRAHGRIFHLLLLYVDEVGDGVFYAPCLFFRKAVSIDSPKILLDLDGFRHVEIFVSGGFTPEKIRQFVEAGAPVNGFGVGAAISSASPNNFTADIHEVDGKPIAKRGRVPGITPNPRLDRVM